MSESAFASELKQAKAPKAAAPAAAPVELPKGGQPAPEAKAAPQTSEQANGFMIPEEIKFDDKGKPAVKAEKPAELPPSEKPAAKVKIGNKEFDSIDKAMEYAQSLEIAKAQDEAYIQGVKDSQKPVAEAPKEKSVEELVENMLFENPKEAVKILKEHILKEVQSASEELDTKKAKEASKQQATDKFWNEFYTDNKDLLELKGVVDYVTQQNWVEVSTVPLAEAKSKIAAKTRELLKIRKDATLQSHELPNGPTTVATSSGSTPSIVTEKPSDEPLDFLSAVNKLRKRQLKKPA